MQMNTLWPWLRSKVLPQSATRPAEANRENELSEDQLNAAVGGKVMHADLQIQKYLDKPSIILF